MDFAEAEYIARLRSGVKGHFSYRKVAWDMKCAMERLGPELGQADGRRYRRGWKISLSGSSRGFRMRRGPPDFGGNFAQRQRFGGFEQRWVQPTAEVAPAQRTERVLRPGLPALWRRSVTIFLILAQLTADLKQLPNGRSHHSEKERS